MNWYPPYTCVFLVFKKSSSETLSSAMAELLLVDSNLDPGALVLK